jgi:hypothetical protein
MHRGTELEALGSSIRHKIHIALTGRHGISWWDLYISSTWKGAFEMRWDLLSLVQFPSPIPTFHTKISGVWKAWDAPFTWSSVQPERQRASVSAKIRVDCAKSRSEELGKKADEVTPSWSRKIAAETLCDTSDPISSRMCLLPRQFDARRS